MANNRVEMLDQEITKAGIGDKQSIKSASRSNNASRIHHAAANPEFHEIADRKLPDKTYNYSLASCIPIDNFNPVLGCSSRIHAPRMEEGFVQNPNPIYTSNVHETINQTFAQMLPSGEISKPMKRGNRRKKVEGDTHTNKSSRHKASLLNDSPCMYAALDLLKDREVDAIIGPQKSVQANFVIGLGDAANVPIISFSATSPSLHTQSSYFVQTALNDAAQVDAIAAIVKYFRWSQVVFVYEDSDYGNGIIPYLSNAFQEVNARVSYRSVIPVSATDDFILKELYKMKTMQTRVFVVHCSSSLASKLFVQANEAEMMSEGYAWIVRHCKVEKLFLQDNPGISRAEMNLFGLWAYDTLWALAMAAEKVGFKEPSSLQNTSVLNSTNMFVTEVSQTGPKLLKAISETTFQGLSGDFHLVKGQREPSSFQILNVVGNKAREVGIWTPSHSEVYVQETRTKRVKI
ncbi:hypothetical protein DH2020_025696 [Rehmannia glutinosa]|uniref:Receptor ligand binding region domain-containing protein n=1 Tax=Rehmannia glutinosa TaxID=99300 RepID=A0ABR0VYZ7_REHGL